MGINISQIKNQNLKELASLVDNSFNGKTRGNGVIDDCEVSVFMDKAKKFGMEAECTEILGLSKTTQKNNVQNVKAEQVAVKKNATTVKQGSIKKSKPNKLELKEKINKKKEEIKQISKKIKDKYTSNSVIGGAGSGVLLGSISGGIVGAAVGAGSLVTLACMATPAVILGSIGAGLAYLITRVHTGDEVVGTDELRRYDGTANQLKYNRKLAEELRKAEQELQVLEKQYNEYK